MAAPKLIGHQLIDAWRDLTAQGVRVREWRLDFDTARAVSEQARIPLGAPFMGVPVRIRAKTPRKHADHDGTKACGCWTKGAGPCMSCRLCGASYLLAEVAGFPVWRCYDCGAGCSTTPPLFSRYAQ